MVYLLKVCKGIAMRIILDFFAMVGFVSAMFVLGYLYQYHYFTPKCGTALAVLTKECK
jgi:hypothetical protein